MQKGRFSPKPQQQDEFIKNNNLSKRYDGEFKKLENLKKDKDFGKSQNKEIEVFFENFKKQPLLVDERDVCLRALVIERSIEGGDGSTNFVFYIEEELLEKA